jgi:hypothetical protein
MKGWLFLVSGAALLLFGGFILSRGFFDNSPELDWRYFLAYGGTLVLAGATLLWSGLRTWSGQRSSRSE